MDSRVEHEREAISERTKAALAAAKARGKRLGTPGPASAVKRMSVARRAQAAQFAANVLPIIRDHSGGRTYKPQRHCQTAQGAEGGYR
jgi:DNA invertase Pin-like site-specific DNA recombinase